MKKNILILMMVFLGISACDLTRSFQTHELISEHYFRSATPAQSALLADLRGDGQEILITSHYENNLGFIILSSLNGKSISQINMSNNRLLGLTTLQDDIEGSRWLFFSTNNDRTMSLVGAKYNWQVPLKREMKYFETFTRNDALIGVDAYSWAAHYLPQVLEDIDGDGKRELVCLALDGFSSNPRGVVAFDWESGAIKWFFRSPANFSKLYFLDLDGDGNKEFLLSNYAFNNNFMDVDGLNDFSGQLVLLNTKGEMIHRHEVFEGLGTLVVNVEDVNQDSRPDIFAVASTRGTNSESDYILRLRYENGRMIRERELVLPKSFSQEANVDFLHRMDSSSEYRLVITDSERGILLFDTDLNEIQAVEQRQAKRIYDIGNLRTKGKKEILAVNNENDLQIFDQQLGMLASIQLPMQNRKIFNLKIIRNKQGKQALVGIIMDNTLVTYYLKPLSSFTLLGRLIQAYALWIAAVLFVVIVLVIMGTINYRRELVDIQNHLLEGTLIVRGRDHICFTNKGALALAFEHDPHCNLKSLKEIFPEIHQKLLNMRQARVKQEDSEVEISGKLMRIHIRETRSFPRHWLILIYPRQEMVDSDNLQWAEIARRLSHHVRRHITNVILALDPIDRKADPDAKEYLEIIKSEIEKVRVFTHAFQRFTEMHSYDLKLQDLIPSMEHALAGIKLPEGIKVIRNYGLKSIHAKIEPIRFEEAIVNTINNATEAMANDGTLHISIREFPQHKSPRGNLSVLVEIEDSGKGIPTKYMEDIWKPFFTTNQSGTGIGIPETQKIIDSMGGIMDIQSEEGVGTTVSLWLKGEHDE